MNLSLAVALVVGLVAGLLLRSNWLHVHLSALNWELRYRKPKVAEVRIVVEPERQERG